MNGPCHLPKFLFPPSPNESSQYGLFRQNLRNIIDHDDEVTLFEFSIEKLIEHRLDNHFKKEKSPKIKHHHLKPLGRELSVILSALANASGSDKNEAFKAGVNVLQKDSAR